MSTSRVHIGSLALFFIIASPACKKLLTAALDQSGEDDASSSAIATPPTAPTLGPTGDPSDEGTSSGVTAKPTVKAGGNGTFAPNCTGTCEKTLKCMNAYNAGEQASCVAECSKNPGDPNRFAALNKKDCPTLLAELKGGGGGGGGSSTTSSSSGGTPKKGNTAPSGCNADCHGCVWDGTSCYYLNGSMMGAGTVYCDACCCAKGGPAKRWE